MNFPTSILATGASLLFLALIFIPMEKAFPAKPNQAIMRKNWKLDLCYFVGQYLLFNGIVLKLLDLFNSWINQLISIEFRTLISHQAIWIQAIEVLVLSDFIIYWGHRLQHKHDFLWRFHKIHHSAEHLDWLAAHREHPIDSIYTVGLINLPVLLLGFNLNSIAVIVAFRGIWAIYIHSNVRLPIGKLKLIIGAPELHHWHHDKERDRGNYANISPMMDVLFGTYTAPENEPTEFGIKEDFPTNYIEQLINPVLPMKTVNKIKTHKKFPK